MDLSNSDWEQLARLRQIFLGRLDGQRDYWRSASDLDLYDRTFGRRIAWKCEHVLGELRLLGWSPPDGPVIDWGCGGGVASRCFFSAFPPTAGATVQLIDRSALAVDFAAQMLRQEQPGVEVIGDLNRSTAAPGCAGRSMATEQRRGHGTQTRVAGVSPACGFTLLVSHVLNELNDSASESLIELAQAASAVIWVEPGTYADSRRLIAVRERLLRQHAGMPAGPTQAAAAQPGAAVLRAVAPCTHQNVCPMLTAGNERHWCHQFAAPPGEVHTDGGWVRFGRELGIDLRALPVSYLVLDRRPACGELHEPGVGGAPACNKLHALRSGGPSVCNEFPALRAGAYRLLGRPRVYKGYAMLYACGADGLRELRVMKRRLPDVFRLARRDDLPTFVEVGIQGQDIVRLRGLGELATEITEGAEEER